MVSGVGSFRNLFKVIQVVVTIYKDWVPRIPVHAIVKSQSFPRYGSHWEIVLYERMHELKHRPRFISILQSGLFLPDTKTAPDILRQYHGHRSGKG